MTKWTSFQLIDSFQTESVLLWFAIYLFVNMNIRTSLWVLFPSLSTNAFRCGAFSKRSRLVGIVTQRSALYSSSSSTTDSNDQGNINLPIHTVTWKTPDNEENLMFNVQDGELLRTAALRRGIVSPHNGRANLINCRGLGTCGTCAVAISQADDWLPPLNAVESFRLAVPSGHGENNAGRLRLACQIVVRGDLTVTKYTGFWGQYDQIAQPSTPTQPFGKAEFLLDRTSPKQLSSSSTKDDREGSS